MTDRQDRYSQYGPRRSLGTRFEAASVAELYRHRPPYSEEVYRLLQGLLPGPGSRVLDIGAGTGKIARELAARGFEVDALDPSAEMIREGRGLPGGKDPRLHWIEGRIEEAELTGDYLLAVAAASFHWLDADGVLPRLHGLLRSGGLLAVVDGDGAWRAPWADAEEAVMIDFVTRIQGRRPEWVRVEIEDDRLLEHPLFEPRGEHVTDPTPVRQRLEDYIACQHSRATFTHEAMGPELAVAFDADLRGVLSAHADDSGWIRYSTRTRIEWGIPRRG